MPHIHTEPGQHDATTSAYIVRLDQPEPLLLVHMHRKLHKLLQVGGHIELHETPWMAITHELREESGYELSELQVLQPTDLRLDLTPAIIHPVPVLLNTHPFNAEHNHSDAAFAFTAQAAPKGRPDLNESQDVRWLTLTELQNEVKAGNAYADTCKIYETILTHFLPTYHQVDPARFLLKTPNE